ncbi:hypothetical protein AB3S75_003384 [Citrus x aurantiifolia]
MGISRRKPLSLRDTLKKPSSPKVSQNEDAGLDESDWRTQLGRGARQRVVNRILVTLKRHLPFSGEESLRELMKIAARFEAKNYAIAMSESDYRQRISLKMHQLDSRSQNEMP